MKVLENVSLKQHSTMRLGGEARYLCYAESEKDLLSALDFASKNSLKSKVIGGGSNIIWSDGIYDGLVIVNNIEKFKINQTKVVIGSGVDWDETVQKTVESNLSGIEFLSLIPGKSGAIPVQNVGAYGREISDVLTDLRAYDTLEKKFVNLSADDCNFGYRKSRFNQEDAGRFIITEITLNLSLEHPKPPFYKALQEYLDKNEIHKYTPQAIRQAVIHIRQSKLPDSSKVANNGSFFANPIISNEKYQKLKLAYPEIPGWIKDKKVKIPAAWLIENSGFSDFHDKETGMGTWPKHPLIIVNESATTTDSLLKFKSKIVNTVHKKFGITLEQEPELISN